MSELPQPNRDQATLWNSGVGATWVELQDLLDQVFAPIAERIVAEGFPGEGGRALDIGCGAGATTLSMARRVGPAGRALGVDISEPLVEAATGRARAEGLAQARFVAADAQTHRFEAAGFDAAISRFGVMFFEDPVAAFGNIRSALRPGGKLAFAAWRSPQENPFMTAAARAAAPLLPGLRAPDPEGPGQFAFAARDRVRRILADAGWRGIDMQPLDAPASLPAAALSVYITRMGPVGMALQGLDAAARAPVVEAVTRAFEPYVQDGVARFDLACWLVTAQA
jgi:SAM-dependent methyltransferase